jgi:uncharacterized protein (TIGR02687 family)
MSNAQIPTLLANLFTESRIVFWNDADQEFSAELASLVPDGVTLVMLDDEPKLQLKQQLEVQDLNGQYLLYSPQAEPLPEDDWLLNIRLYSRIFRADAVSVQLEELKLVNQAMREHLKRRAKFLRNKDRLEKLKRLTAAQDDETALDRKMLAVITRADQPEPFAIVYRMMSAMIVDGHVQMEAQPKILDEIIALELEVPFWAMVYEQFGYQAISPALPSLRDLAYHLLVTDFALARQGSFPSALQSFVLQEGNKLPQITVFCDRWRRDLAHFASYDAISEAVADGLKVGGHLSALDHLNLLEVQTFSDVEKRLLVGLRDVIQGGDAAALVHVQAIAAKRRDGHWANTVLAAQNPVIKAFGACYDAIEAAAAFSSLAAHYAHGFSYPTAEAMFQAYQKELFRFDQCYRHFMLANDVVELNGWLFLQSLKEWIGERYSWYMAQLASTWGSFVAGDSCENTLLQNWSIPDVRSQQHFFQQYVQPIVDAGARNRAYVLISDALRFEVAQELYERSVSTNRFKASLDGVLGVLPSYTTLGMAALLPHKRLDYRATANAEVFVDGKPSASLEQRSAILESHDGIAIKSDSLVAMGKEAGREFVKPYKVVYLYHDQIDATGDKQSTESETFSACEKAINEIEGVIRYIINTLGGSIVLITADHGFLYQEEKLDEADKSALAEKPEGTLKAKKRYLIGQDLGQSPKAWAGNTAVTAGTTDSLDFWVPKGANRFHFTGGARFVHGGAMLQEIVVPVLTVRATEHEKSKIRPVEITLLGSTRKVVTNKQKFEFIQTEAITDKVLARTVLVSLRDTDGDKLISNEASLTFDSSSNLMDERKKSVMLTVLGGSYNKNKEYALVLRDALTKAEVDRVNFRIDLAFNNDF